MRGGRLTVPCHSARVAPSPSGVTQEPSCHILPAGLGTFLKCFESESRELRRQRLARTAQHKLRVEEFTADWVVGALFVERADPLPQRRVIRGNIVNATYHTTQHFLVVLATAGSEFNAWNRRSEEHTSELQ